MHDQRSPEANQRLGRNSRSHRAAPRRLAALRELSRLLLHLRNVDARPPPRDRRDWSYFPHDSSDVETNTTIPQHAEQMKEDSANGETRKGCHVAECEAARRRDPLDDGVDRYEGVSSRDDPRKGEHREQTASGEPLNTS